MRRAPLAAFFVCAIFFSACRTPIPESRVLSSDDPRPQRFMAAIESEAASRKGLQAAARLSLDSPDVSFRRPQRLAVERPARLRIEVLGLFNQVAAVLVTRADRYQFLDVSRARVEEGQMTPSLLWQYARVDLTPEQAVDLLLGAPRPLPGLAAVSGRGLADDGVRVVLQGKVGGVSQQYDFDAAGRLARVATFNPVGDLLWEAVYGDYRDVDGAKFPFEVRLQFPRLQAKTEVVFSSVQLNPDLPDALFVLNVPGRAAGSAR